MEEDKNSTEEDKNSSEPTFTISEEDFRVAVSPPDLKGRINLRLEQMLQQEIEDIAEDVRYPLKSISEVVRFCCLIGLQRLRQWKPAPTLLGSIKAANALLVRDRIQCESLDLINRLDERIRWYISKSEFDEAINLAGQVRSYFEVLENEFWKTYILQEISQKEIGWFAEIERVKESKRTTEARKKN